MLEELSKHDKKWINMALSICGCKELARDITQDMYIKIYDSGKKFKEINEWFVYITLKNLYLHHIRKTKKTILFSDAPGLNKYFERIRLNTENGLLTSRKIMNDALNELHHYDREILLHTSERSLRKNMDYLLLTVDVLFNSRKNALKKLNETYTIKKYKSA